MRRSLAKWYVSRSLDLDKPVPAWVAKWIDRDAVLQEHMNVSQALEDRLRNDASTWATDNPSVEGPVAPPTWQSASSTRFCLAVAAIVFLAIIWNLRPVAPEPPSTASQTAIAKASWRLGRRVTERLSRQSRNSMAAIPTLPTPDLGAIAKTRIEATSRLYGRAVGTLHRCIKTEQETLVNGFQQSLTQMADQMKRDPTRPPTASDSGSASPRDTSSGDAASEPQQHK